MSARVIAVFRVRTEGFEQGMARAHMHIVALGFFRWRRRGAGG